MEVSKVVEAEKSHNIEVKNHVDQDLRRQQAFTIGPDDKSASLQDGPARLFYSVNKKKWKLLQDKSWLLAYSQHPELRQFQA